jgi:hypothetical protein
VASLASAQVRKRGEGGVVMPELVCPDGHTGPWRYVEAIEVWREVLDVTETGLVINSYWQTGEGYNDGVPGSGYLQCWAAVDGGGKCVEEVPLPDVDIEWE